MTKKQKFYWAGAQCRHGIDAHENWEIHISMGEKRLYASFLFETKKEAKKFYGDVRKVKIVEVK